MADIRRVLSDLARDEVIEVNGEVKALDWRGNLTTMHVYIVGWCAVWQRVIDGEKLNIDLKPLLRLAPKLEHGELLTIEEVAAASHVVDRMQAACLFIDGKKLHDYVLTEQIAVEMSVLKEAA